MREERQRRRLKDESREARERERARARARVGDLLYLAVAVPGFPFLACTALARSLAPSTTTTTTTWWMDTAGTVELHRRRRQYAEQEEGRREGRFIHSQLVVSCVCVSPARRQERIKSAARERERELEEGRRAVIIPVCLFRLRRPSPESPQDGEADGGDDRGPDEGVRHGQR